MARNRLAAAIEGAQSGETLEVRPNLPLQFAEVFTIQVDRDPKQPRQFIGDLTELKASISRHGIIEPIIVRRVDDATYRLIAGERRWRAAKELGLERVPAIIRELDANDTFEVQLVENLHRKDLNAVEEAMGYKVLIDEYNISQSELGRRLGKSVATINETLRVLSLHPDILETFRTSEKVPRSVLLEISKQPAKTQLALWEQAQRGELTVRKVRELKTPSIDRVYPYRVSIPVGPATVTVTFGKEAASTDEVLEALRNAVALYESEHV